MGTQEANIDGDFQFLLPGLADFRRLFYPEIEPPKKNEDPLRAQQGIPHGSTILISGPAGAGKTVFTLSLVRSLMVEFSRTNPTRKASKEQEIDWSKPPLLFYVSLEVFPERLETVGKPFGWLSEGDTIFRKREVGSAPKTIEMITAQPEIDRPVPNTEELVSHIFSKISSSQDPGDKRPVIVVVDSLTALIRSKADYSERRRQAHEAMFRLRKIFGEKRLLLSVLIAERSTSAGATPTGADPVTTIEEYLADIVFRLDQQHLPLGRRLRTLEIPKSQGINMLTGQHTWVIATNKTVRQLFPYEHFQKRIAESARAGFAMPAGASNLSSEEEPWGTAVILPRSRAYTVNGNSGEGQAASPQSSQGLSTDPELISTGTAGLDEMLKYTAADWLGSATSRSHERRELRAGKHVVLVGPSGTGKTTIGLQFLFGDTAQCPPNPAEQLENGRPVFVTFDLTKQAAENRLRNRWASYCKMAKQPQPRPLPAVDLLVLRQAHIDPNLVLAQLKESIGCSRPRRMLIDGLSSWIATFPLEEQARILDAVVSLVRETTNRAGLNLTVFFTFDSPSSHHDSMPSDAAISADIVVALKTVTLNDTTRTLIYIVKATEQNHDHSVREVVFEGGGPLKIVAGFDEYTNLLRQTPKPATVYLQFFAENRSEVRWNEWARSQLAGSKRVEFQSLEITRTENARTLALTGQRALNPPSDLRILTVDEWWLSGLNMPGGDGHQSLLPLDPIWQEANIKAAVPNWHDFWFFELAKAISKSQTKALSPPLGIANTQSPSPSREADAPPPTAPPKGNTLAVPGYMDFGMFCFNSSAYERLQAKRHWRPVPGQYPGGFGVAHPTRRLLPDANDGSAQARRHTLQEAYDMAVPRRLLWAQILGAFPGAWVRDEWISGVPTMDAKGPIRCLLDILPFRKEPDWPYLFAFDASTPETCACFWFELAWAFGADWEFLSTNHSDGFKPAIDALVFLQELILRGLMPARGTIEDTSRAVFSRQWYSTLTYLREDEGCSDSILLIPFWPVGKSDLRTLAAGLVDAVKRLKRILPRIVETNMAVTDVISQVQSQLSKIEGVVYDELRKPQADYQELRKSASKTNEIARELVQILHENWAGSLRLNSHTSGEKEVLGPDRRDALEHLQSHYLRMNLLSGFTHNHELHRALQRWQLSPLSSDEWNKELADEGSKPVRSCLTGYGCSGSWLFAIHEGSRNIGMASDILAELTSAKAAEKRAELSAGMPSRKDFYHTAGDHPVPGAEHLSWRELLRFAGARARSRISTFVEGDGAPRPDIAFELHNVAESLLDLLQLADLERESALKDPESFADSLANAKIRATRFMEDLRVRVISQ